VPTASWCGARWLPVTSSSHPAATEIRGSPERRRCTRRRRSVGDPVAEACHESSSPSDEPDRALGRPVDQDDVMGRVRSS
jgi:hypothetical protein